MHTTVACIIVRMNSTRFPGKALTYLHDDTTQLSYLIQRLQRVASIAEICVCTTQNPEDDILEEHARAHGVHVYRGSEDDVVSRMLGAADMVRADTIVRVTGDNPLTAVDLLDRQIAKHHAEHLEFSRFVRLPLGMTADVISAQALRRCASMMSDACSEYVLFTIFDPTAFRCGVLELRDMRDYGSESISIDTPSDLQRVRRIIQSHPDPLALNARETLSHIDEATDGTYAFGTDTEVRIRPDATVAYAVFQEDMLKRAHASQRYVLDDIDIECLSRISA